MSIRAEQVTYSIQVKTSDKLFAGTDNDVYIRIGCVKSKQCLCAVDKTVTLTLVTS